MAAGTINWKHPALVAVIAATLGIAANTIVAVVGGIFAAGIEERRDRREVVIELMRSNNRDQMLERLAILSDSGLLPDEDGKLKDAVASSRIVVGCDIDMNELPSIPEKVGKRLTGNAQRDSAILAGNNIELRAYAEGLRDVLGSCAR